ncbi:hypothetical protein DEI97_010175 [Curtobacterium sp. MCLR17_032]|uniref:hypothetical protein n=1 Tax=Curtobacterium sp. MCLR17_032 TaxID=2175650 RepID=UPI000DA974E7|nr:hypothetical protein [Curtobacterium sp. MCLR17_032]WIE60141.1 hypothetical protein DEI97_010175 [Curtobacterium sp. MCLR17_032]
MMHDGWCPDCDLPSAVIDVSDDGQHAWASCAECGTGWVHRDELPEARTTSGTSIRRPQRTSEQRAA